VDKVVSRLKNEFTTEDARYAYADSVTNAFLTGQIKELREARNLRQEDLAELVGTQQSGVSRWLNSGFSKCKVETLRKFSRAFGVRLRISFEEFGTLPDDIKGFTKERLAPRRFEDDPVFFSKSEMDSVNDLRAMIPAASPLGYTVSPIDELEWMMEIPRPQGADLEIDETSPAGNDHLWTDTSLAALKEPYPNAYTLMELLNESRISEQPEPKKALAETPKGLAVMPAGQSSEIGPNPIRQMALTA